jgi:hypothetical protein
MQTLGYIAAAALALVVVAAGAYTIAGLPDMRRYMKMKRM